MRKSRRGSMQLGIETVVILIIAIVLLGSMIYFIKSLISPDDLKKQLEIERGCGKTIIPNDATPVLPDSMVVEYGRNNEVGLCVYNDFGKSLTGVKVHFTSCLKPDGTAVADPATMFKVMDLGWDYDRTGKPLAHKFQIEPISPPVTEDDLGNWLCRIQISAAPGPINDANPGVGPVPLTLVLE